MHEDKLLDGKVILISSGTKGVGREMVFACARQGAQVVFSGRDVSAASRIGEDLKTEGLNADFVRADASSLVDIDALFAHMTRTYDRLDGYVNYLGITPVASLVNTTEEMFDRVFDINVKSAFFSTGKALDLMQKNGGGSIVLFGSAHSWSGQKDRAAYAVSKGALFTLCEHIAHNYAVENIRCNYLTMGWTATDGELALRASQGISKESLDLQAQKNVPMGRMCTPDDLVPGVLYLLSEYASFVTGSNIRCTGGEYL